MKRKDTQILVENWRRFLNNEQPSKKQLNEIDISSLMQPALDAINAYGIPSVLAGIGLSAGIKLTYQKLINHFIKKPENKEAFILFVKIIGKDLRYDKFESLVNSSGDVDTTIIDQWIASGDEVVKKSMESGKIKFNRSHIESIEQELQSSREGLRGDFFNERIKSLLKFWNSNDAITQFEAILESGDESSGEMLINIYNAAESHYEEYFKDAEEKHRFWTSSPETMAVLDVLFETMLLFYKISYSTSSREAAEAFSLLEKEFAGQIEIEKDELGTSVVRIKQNTDENCILSLAAIMIKHEASANYQSHDAIATIRSDDYAERNDIIEKYHLERQITSDKMKKLKSLKRFLLFAKKFVGASPAGGVLMFLKVFVKDFIKDEVLSKVAAKIQSNIDENSSSQPKDFEKRELIKYIISMLLE